MYQVHINTLKPILVGLLVCWVASWQLREDRLREDAYGKEHRGEVGFTALFWWVLTGLDWHPFSKGEPFFATPGGQGPSQQLWVFRWKVPGTVPTNDKRQSDRKRRCICRIFSMGISQVHRQSVCLSSGMGTESWKKKPLAQALVEVIPSWERSHIPYQGTFEEDFPFPHGGIC